MLKRFIAFVLGHLRITVTGGRMEKFLNLAVAHGLYLWQIERKPDRMLASLTIADFRRLRPVAKGAQCRVHILRRRGLPFKLSRLWRRPILILGALACMAFVMWAAGHIWIIRVKITGPEVLDWRAVEAVAAEAGLRVGVWKHRIDPLQIQQYVQKRMGEVSWVVVRVQGTRAVIEVVEKPAQKQPAQPGCINLVARKHGVVEQVVPFMGEPAVRKGDTVKSGDLLVECSFRYWEGGRPLVIPGTPLPPRTAVARILVAQALVKARITYREFQQVNLIRKVEVPTGREVLRWVLNWKDRSIILRGSESIPFEHYREQRRAYTLRFWRNWGLPVELVMINTAEVEERQERIPIETALNDTRQRLAEQLQWSLGASDRILGEIKAVVLDERPDSAGIQVTAETLEEIAAPQAGTAPEPIPAEPKSP